MEVYIAVMTYVFGGDIQEVENLGVCTTELKAQQIIEKAEAQFTYVEKICNVSFHIETHCVI